MSVPDAEVATEFERRNEKVKLELVNLTADGFRSQVTVTAADVQARFDANKETYRIGEKRKVRYALVEVDKVRERVQVPPADIQAFYEQNKAQYSTEGRVRASHILLKTEGKDEAAVRAKAEDLLKQARSGADFAALAKANSEDEGSAVNGGDLNYFGRGQMVPEFEQAAFSLKSGEVSDLVKTTFGFHIIKVIESQPETTRPLAEVTPEIVDQLKWQKAQQQAEQDGKAMEATIKTAADLDRVAKERGIAVVESPLFLRDEPIGELGASPDLASRAFSMKDGEVTPALRVTRGWVLATPAGKQDSYLPQLAEVADRVREDAVRDKAAELVKSRAGAIADELKKAADFTAAAKQAGFEAKTSELVARGAALPDIGVNPVVEAAVFGLPVGGVAAPIATPNGQVIARVAERADVTDVQIAEGRDGLRHELVNQQRDRFFMAYMAKAKTALKIEIRQDVLAQVMGPMPAPPSFPAPVPARPVGRAARPRHAKGPPHELLATQSSQVNENRPPLVAAWCSATDRKARTACENSPCRRTTSRSWRSSASSGTGTRTSSPRASSASTDRFGSSATPWPSATKRLMASMVGISTGMCKRDTVAAEGVEDPGPIGRRDMVRDERLVAEHRDANVGAAGERVVGRDDEHQLVVVDDAERRPGSAGS